MRKFSLDFSTNRRMVLLAVIYAAVVTACYYFAYEVRFDFLVPEFYADQRLRHLWVAVGVKLVALVMVRQLGSMVTYFSLPDLLRLAVAMTVASFVLTGPRIVGLGMFIPPRGVLLVDYLLSLGGLCALRLGMRLYRERVTAAARGPGGPLQRIAIVGAGDAGAALAREFVNSPSRGFKPVIFLDDDQSTHGKLVHGVPVVGTPEQIGERGNLRDISKVVIAMPSASARRIREVVLLMTQRGLKVETLPSLEELASGRVKATRIRPVEVQDLLGRDAVDLDSAGIRRLVEGKIVMVTGAGGSIGAELCRQIAALNPSRLLLVEQAEGALFTIEQELDEIGMGSLVQPLIADVLDAARMEAVFSRYRPAIIFHAAAHKHVYLMERQPGEAFKNNVLGTRGMAELAARHGAEAFILISTDKAINPTSVMGATKRLAEIELQRIQAARAGATKFLAVRFGNVLGSSGSVIPIFKRQIANGGPITVTHPEVTRYFMTIPEAVGLVLQSAVIGTGGEIFVLNMGEPVKIVDLARQMIELSGYRVGEDIEIKFTGLKPGEKLFEELRHTSEEHTPTAHPHIMRFVSSHALAPDAGAAIREVEARLGALDQNEIKAELQRLVPEYHPHLD